MNLITRYSRDFQGNMTVDPEGSWVLAGDAVIRDKRLMDKINALQLMLNDRDDQLTSLEQRRYAEQQAREAAEKNADRYRWLLGNADIMHWENMLRCADLEGVESINQFIDAAINLAAEAASHVD